MADARGNPQPSLRQEHDDLARRLESRLSVDLARNGLVVLFAGTLALGVAGALVWDRYDKVDPSDLGLAHPALFLGAAAVGAVVGMVLLVRGGLMLRRSRRHARDEAILFQRLLELRRLLELDT